MRQGRRKSKEPTFGDHPGLADGQQGQQEGGVGPQQPQQRGKVVHEAQAARRLLAAAWGRRGSGGGAAATATAGARAVKAAAQQRLCGGVDGSRNDLHGWLGPCCSNWALRHGKCGSCALPELPGCVARLGTWLQAQLASRSSPRGTCCSAVMPRAASPPPPALGLSCAASAWPPSVCIVDRHPRLRAAE